MATKFHKNYELLLLQSRMSHGAVGETDSDCTSAGTGYVCM